ncbi:MAG TPA: decaprenyl-phosphate phosphoribosyltransferase [Dehalococcoidia bacterium]
MEQPATATAPEGPRPRAPSRARALLRAVRPKQWVKNLLVFAAVVFSVDEAWEPGQPDTWLPLLARAGVAFLAFTMAASAEYLVNDLRDREQDRVHPKKRHRPIASGLVSTPLAVGTAAALAAESLVVALTVGWELAALVAGYLAMMLGYSFGLKHVVIVDLMVIATGFVLRAVAGGVATDIPLSPWIYVCTMLGALFLGINKRRNELTLLADGAADHRPILDEYTLPLLDQMTAVVTSSTVVAYALYTVTAENLPDNHAMLATVPFVLYGIFRYLYLVHRRDLGGSPEEIVLSDLPLIAAILLWAATAAGILLVSR